MVCVSQRLSVGSLNNRAVKSIQLVLIVKITSHFSCLKQTLWDVWPRGLVGPLDSFLIPECLISVVKDRYELTTPGTVYKYMKVSLLILKTYGRKLLSHMIKLSYWEEKELVMWTGLKCAFKSNYGLYNTHTYISDNNKK